MSGTKRLTQKEIARLAGVSQSAVSMVLNDSAAAAGRIPEETRERIHKVIRETGYVVDPVARKMASGRNRILGVFTYEPAFPSAQSDFFAPFFLGIEEAAQELGYDLLLLTGSSGVRKKIFSENVRLRLADGCLVLGMQFNRDELERLVGGDYPFAAIGRRDDAGGPVPYCGADYVSATHDLVQRAKSLGHRRLAYVGPEDGAESLVDRWKGFLSATDENSELVSRMDSLIPSPEDMLDGIVSSGATVVFFTELSDAVKVQGLALAREFNIPEDFSIVVLGRHARAADTGTRFSTFRIPREEMGREAARMLVRRIEGNESAQQILLNCDLIEGETLGAVFEGL
ncbi:MAG: LacI family transcriptional regulator [Hyphomicrobiales bacterium]|nr:MAG: LacI family transcriptional regulator [Hyphomicrobiales bacterium]